VSVVVARQAAGSGTAIELRNVRKTTSSPQPSPPEEEREKAPVHSSGTAPNSMPAAGSARLYLFDATRPESRAARAIVDDALQRAEGRIDPTPVRDKLVTEPGSRYIDFLIPGLLGFNLMSSGLWGVGFVIVDMRVRKLIKRMMATPMSRSHFLLSFVLVRGAFL